APPVFAADVRGEDLQLGSLRELSQLPAADLRQLWPAPRLELRASDATRMAQQYHRSAREGVPLLPGLSHADAVPRHASRVKDRKQRIEPPVSPDHASPPRRRDRADRAEEVLASRTARSEPLPEP